jgi:sialic acid synthase SpsE
MVFIIAECSVNFRSLDEAAIMIEHAARAGVDAVKFRAYRAEDVRVHERYEELVRTMLMSEDISYLKEVCDYNHVEFMCTPTYPQAVTIISPHVKRWKIQFSDRNNVDLHYALCQDPRSVLVSCSNKRDSIFLRRPLGRTNTIWMFCVSQYPPQGVIWPRSFGYKSGFSSHYTDPGVPLRAVKKGASYVEVHVKLDEYPGGWLPIEDVVSLDMTTLAQLIKSIRAYEKTIPFIEDVT